MHRKTWVGYLVALALVAAAGFWLVRGDSRRIGMPHDADVQPSAAVESRISDAFSAPEVASIREDGTSVSRREALGVFPAADVVRFDPAAWPALPSDDLPIRDSVAAMLDRAERGDAGAACWLGVKFRGCNEARIVEPQLNALNEHAKGSISPSGNVAFALEQQEEVVDALVLCQGMDSAVMSRRLELTRQAALAGSKAAIAEMMGLDGTTEAGFPDAEQVQQTLDERQAILWAGLLAGVPESFRQVTLDTRLYMQDSVTSPVVPDLSPDDVRATNYLMFEVGQAMIRRYPILRLDPELDSSREMATAIGDKVPEAKRQRIAAIVEEMRLSEWPDLEVLQADVDRFKTTQTACADFGDPVDVSVSIKEVVGP